MKLSLTVDASAFQVALRRYLAESGSNIAKAIRYQGRMVYRMIQRLTPPQTAGQGKRAVKRDLTNAITPMPLARLAQSRNVRAAVRRHLKSGNMAAANAVLARANVRVSGKVPTIVEWSPAWHKQARDSRGRVLNPTGRVVIGRAGVAAWRAYLKVLQYRVGMAKGGWSPAVQALGGKPPAYAVRWASKGSFRDTLRNDGTGFLEATNRSPWAGYRSESERIANYALRYRAKAIVEALNKAAAKAAAKAGFATA